MNAKNLNPGFFKANSKIMSTKTANKQEAAMKNKMPVMIATASSLASQKVSAKP